MTVECGTVCRILDNLPIAMPHMREGKTEAVKTYERGFPVGHIEASRLALRVLRLRS